MIWLTVILFLYTENLLAAPDWVEGLRSGEERFKLKNGTTTIFRQLAQSCETAIANIEKDMEREFNSLVNYTTEMVYEDEQGCAVTVSVPANYKLKTTDIKTYMLKRAQMAQKHAYYGLTYKEFQKFTNDPSPILVDSTGWCKRAVNTVYESVHGIVNICWKNNVIQAHCVPKAGACWKDAP